MRSVKKIQEQNANKGEYAKLVC